MKEKLLEKAFEAMGNAYAPYSNYHVGSAFLLNDGTIVIGANIENASFGATNCAERSAVYAAYSQGYRQNDIQAVAIVTDGKILAGPCGICRQVLSELIPGDCPIYLSNKKESKDTTINELMPFQFGKKDLDEL
ncbi:cytidine deaminase [Erysipelothrix urinaevulpis]|uniref:cytidine deaminase n=1 Tax=Erysipelothrix urinaevulpis TaxID=2683717 RepID=UPI0013599118|nr:cytidine deaminase [Erysipelothrix urinaevulpis]